MTTYNYSNKFLIPSYGFLRHIRLVVKLTILDFNHGKGRTKGIIQKVSRR
jgi:hypothetical protein